MYNLTSVFSDYRLNISQKPAIAAHSGTVVSRRNSPVLSQQELQRLILDMVG
jgi:hypothetical protein